MRTRRSSVAAARLLCGVVLAGAVVSGCGGDADKTPQLDSARLAAVERLTAAQYAPIEHVYVAAVAAEKSVRSAAAMTGERFAAAVKPVLASCDDLDARDPLLGALRASCPDVANFSTALREAHGCSDDAACASAFGAAGEAARDAAASSRFSDRAVRATALPAACKRALVTPAALYRELDELESGLAAMQRALTSASRDDDAAAATQMLGVTDVSSTPSPRRLLSRLRRGCR